MSKKIKIIELWNINAQIEDANKLPKRIKYEGNVYELQMSRDYFCEEKDAYLTKEIDSKPFDNFLNDYVEILEDNTEEIEELIVSDEGFIKVENGCWKGRKLDVAFANKINELVKAVKELRKEKKMTKEEMDSFANIFKTNNWNDCIQWIEDYWNTDYGTINEIDTPDGKFILELTTGGWSENEYIIDMLEDTMFWFLWWQESKRGGYYKFIFVDRIMDNESEDKQ